MPTLILFLLIAIPISWFIFFLNKHTKLNLFVLEIILWILMITNGYFCNIFIPSKILF